MTTMDKLFKAAVRRWTRPWPTGTEPMEIRRAVLDEVESRIVSAGGGKRGFPFNRLRIRLLAPGSDEEGRVRRRNDMAFQEEGEVNQTVSREHARILYDEASGELRLRAEPGASSTRIFRDGRTIDVSGRDARGVKIQSGDEIYFGRASVKVTIRPGD